MVKHTQAIIWQRATNCLSVFAVVLGWRFKGQIVFLKCYTKADAHCLSRTSTVFLEQKITYEEKKIVTLATRTNYAVCSRSVTTENCEKLMFCYVPQAA